MLAAAALVSVCIAVMHASPLAAQSPSAEYQVKAAFLYNFAKFIEWPSQAFPRSDVPFTICVAGDPFEGALDKTIQGETFDSRPLVVRRMTPGEEARGCQMIYVGPPEARRSAEIITAAANAPILTVGESDDFINAGGMIRFTKAGGRIHFQINPDAAERASLKVSSRLLRLAEIVRPRQRAGLR